jgi:hypothetical protein
LKLDTISAREAPVARRAEARAAPEAGAGFAQVLQDKLQNTGPSARPATPEVPARPEPEASRPDAAEAAEVDAVEAAEAPYGAEASEAAPEAPRAQGRAERSPRRRGEGEGDATEDSQGAQAAVAAAASERLGLGAGSASPGRMVMEGDSAAGLGAEAGPPRAPGGLTLAEPEAPVAAPQDGPALPSEEDLEGEVLELFEAAGEGLELPAEAEPPPARAEPSPAHAEAPRHPAADLAGRLGRFEAAAAPRATGWDAELVEQVQASQQLAQLKDGRMRLSIQEGGERVTVTIQERDGVMHMRARMGSRALAEAMNERVFELREALAVHGMALAEFSAHAEPQDQRGGEAPEGGEADGAGRGPARPVSARAVPLMRRQILV